MMSLHVRFSYHILTYTTQTGTFKSTDHRAVDHNLYIEDGVMFQSNYGAGVWVKDVRSIARHPDGSRVRTLAFFDMHPEDDAVSTHQEHTHDSS